MKDLVPKNGELSTALSGYLSKVRQFQEIRDIDDFDRLILRGMGLRPNTYRLYRINISFFLKFVKHKTPFQWLINDMEMWHDEMEKQGLDRNTIVNRLFAVKKICSSLKSLFPFMSDPFSEMDEKMKKRLFKRKDTQGTLSALTKEEVNGVLDMLLEPPYLSRLISYNCIYLLVTSGLRASEAISLKWKDLELITEEGQRRVYCTFVSKGGSMQKHELYLSAVDTLGAYHWSIYGKDEKEKHLLIHRHGNGLDYGSLYKRVVRVGQEAKRRGIIRPGIKFTPHTMRRTYVTLLFKQGMDARSVQKLSRHKSIEILFRHYIDTSEPPAPYLNKIFKSELNDKKGDKS
jgi:integrase/recombinase XerD